MKKQFLVILCLLLLFTQRSVAFAENIRPINNTEEIQSRYHMYGRLYIDSADINVALFHVNLKEKYGSLRAQIYTDAEDSAAIYQYGVQRIIADHDFQEFEKLKDVEVDDIADIQIGTEHYYYKCVKKCLGINNGKLYDDNGNLLSRQNKKRYFYVHVHRNRRRDFINYMGDL